VFVGAFTRILVDTEAGERLTIVRQNDSSGLEPGARVHVSWNDADAYEIQPPEQQLQQEVK
jgi:TOBE domain